MKRVLAFLPLGLWAAAVLALGALQLSTPTLPTGWDKVAHFFLYGIGGGIAAWTGRRQGRRAGIGALVFVLLVGAADEIRQSTLAMRHGDLLDWLADGIGAVLFYVIAARMLPKKEIDRV